MNHLRSLAVVMDVIVLAVGLVCLNEPGIQTRNLWTSGSLKALLIVFVLSMLLHICMVFTEKTRNREIENKQILQEQRIRELQAHLRLQKETEEYRKQSCENVAHQMKTQLSTALLYTGGCPQAGKLQESLQNAFAIADSFIAASSCLPSAAEYHYQIARIDQILQDAVLQLAEFADQKHISLVLENLDPVEIAVDQNSLLQAFKTLIENSIQNCPVRTDIHVSGKVSGNRYVIRFLNPGHLTQGMSKRYSSTGSGHYGIGLSMAQQIVMRHFGEITINQVSDQVEIRISLLIHKLENLNRE
ncbi:sensor histidine kinase [uncultured Faecalibaculum sp.]|uniref:sensor histidine kinase n=2 Tax=uncultured Faecalibaculum sp. TaxID=1729681 RepID=UPI00351DF593